MPEDDDEPSEALIRTSQSKSRQQEERASEDLRALVNRTKGKSREVAEPVLSHRSSGKSLQPSSFSLITVDYVEQTNHKQSQAQESENEESEEQEVDSNDEGDLQADEDVERNDGELDMADEAALQEIFEREVRQPIFVFRSALM